MLSGTFGHYIHSILPQPLRDLQHKFLILLRKSRYAVNDLLCQCWIFAAIVEKLLRSDFKVLANGKKFTKGRHRPTRRYALDISFTVSECKAHLVFGHIFLQSKLRDSVADILFRHFHSPFVNLYHYTYYNIYNVTILPLILVLFLDIYRSKGL